MAKVTITNPQPSRCPLGPAFRFCGIGRRNKPDPFAWKDRKTCAVCLRDVVKGGAK